MSLAGGLLIYWAFQWVDWSDENEPASGGPEATELRTLREQVRKLEGSVASSERLAREAQAIAQAAQAVSSQRGEEPSAPARSPEPSQQEQRAQSPAMEGLEVSPHEPSPQELVEQMDARFFSEGVDLDWSREARPRAERFGVTLPEGARIVSLECRSSMCRVEMSHPSLESFQGFIHQSVLRGEHEWNGPVMAAIKSDPRQPGEIQAVAFLAREGIDLSPATLEAP